MAFIRDPEKIKACLKELPDGQLLTTQPCRIQVPVRFSEIGLAQLGIETYIFGIYALILNDNSYAVSNVNAMIKIKPSKTITVTIDDKDYHEFYFEANETVIVNVNAVKRDELMYNVFNELFFQGKVPWYITYNDLGKIFDTAAYHAGSNVAENYAVIELISSLVARSPKDRTKYFRTIVDNEMSLKTNKAEFIPLMSVYYAATNTLNKIAGSYFSEGIVSSLVTPTKNVERIERLLRS